MKKSKQTYKYFETNWSNIKNTLKGIRSLISPKTVASSAPTVLSFDIGNTKTNPYDTDNTFNSYSSSIDETVKNNVKYSHKHLKNECDSTIFLQPTSLEKVADIISFLSSNKASVTNSMPYIMTFINIIFI